MAQGSKDALLLQEPFFRVVTPTPYSSFHGKTANVPRDARAATVAACDRDGCGGPPQGYPGSTKYQHSTTVGLLLIKLNMMKKRQKNAFELGKARTAQHGALEVPARRTAAGRAAAAQRAHLAAAGAQRPSGSC